MTKQEIVDLFTEYGDNLFGVYASEIGEALANEVIEEVEEAGDDNIQKAIAYVVLDKFNAL